MKVKTVTTQSLVDPTTSLMEGPGGRHDNDFPDFHDISVLPTADELSSKLADVRNSAIKSSDEGDWTWEDMENERLRGLELANHFDALNNGHAELRGGDVLGKFGDFW